MARNTELDAAIHAVYGTQPHSVDTIVCNPPIASRFAESVRAKTNGEDLSDETILRRSMTLRKYGANKGGLPRKPR